MNEQADYEAELESVKAELTSALNQNASTSRVRLQLYGGF